MSENTQIIRQRLFKTENYLGAFDPNRPGGYDALDQCSLFGCVWESINGNNTTAPAVWDGGEQITPNTTDWTQVSGDYEAWLMNKDKPATTGTTGDYPYNGMGRVTLKKNMVNTAGEGEPEVLVNMLTQDMFYKDGPSNTRVPNTNTIFEVPYEFELAEDITIPDNCVLDFKGGSIIGAVDCTLTLNDCYLDGQPKFDTVVFSGNIKNDMFDVTCIVNGSDIGAKMNYAQTYFKRLYSPKGVYTYETPIVLEGMSKLVCETSLYYAGAVTNHGAAFKIKNTGLAYIHVHSLGTTGAAQSALNFAANRSVNFIGLNLSSVHTSEIHVDIVSSFNECIRCDDRYAGTSGIPFGYNKLYLQYVANFNFGLRFFPMTAYGVSENNVYGGRFTSSGASSYGGVYNVVIGGSGLDNESYRESGLTDIGVGAIMLDQCCFENHAPLISALLVKDVNGIIVNFCRQEGIAKLFTCYGDCMNLICNSKDNNYFSVNDYSHADKIAFPVNYFPRKITIDPYPSNKKCAVLSTHQYIYPFNAVAIGFAYNSYSIIMSSTQMVEIYNGYIGTYINLSQLTRKIMAVNVVDGETKVKTALVFFDENETRITSLTDYNVVPGFSINTNNLPRLENSSTSQQFINLSRVPSTAKYMFVGVGLTDYCKSKVEIYAFNGIFSEIATPVSGATADRPSAYPWGKAFFDTTLGKNIFWNGTAWTDAAGNAV